MGDRFCKNCGSEIIENAEFCGNCGAKLTETDVEFKERGTIGMFDENNLSNDLENPLNGDILNNAFYGKPKQTPPKKKNTGLIVGIVAAVLLVLSFIGMTAEKSLQNRGNEIEETMTSKDDYTVNSDDEDEKKEYVKGVFTDTMYTSDFIEIQYNAPEGWVLVTESELAQMPADNKTTWEMQAISGFDGSNIIVGVEKLPSENFSESMYINTLKNTLKNNTQIMVDNIEEAETKMIAGKEYHVLTCTLTQSGVSLTQTYFLRKIDTYIAVLVVTSTSTGVDEMLSGFSEY